MTNYVLWDVDGTLLRNGGAEAGTLYDEAIKDVTGFQPGGRRPAEHGKVDGQIIAERLDEYGLSQDHHEAVSARLEALSRERHTGASRRELAPGVREALAAVAAAGWANCLLTGNSPGRARAKFDGAGLDADLFDWEHSYFGNRARARSEVTANARAGLGDAPVVIIGDTPTDDVAAQSAGIPFIAVATGIYSTEDLRNTGAIVVLDDLASGLDTLLATLGELAGQPARS